MTDTQFLILLIALLILFSDRVIAVAFCIVAIVGMAICFVISLPFLLIAALVSSCISTHRKAIR